MLLEEGVERDISLRKAGKEGIRKPSRKDESRGGRSDRGDLIREQLARRSDRGQTKGC
jgi:hypothetical protein